MLKWCSSNQQRVRIVSILQIFVTVLCCLTRLHSKAHQTRLYLSCWRFWIIFACPKCRAMCRNLFIILSEYQVHRILFGKISGSKQMGTKVVAILASSQTYSLQTQTLLTLRVGQSILCLVCCENYLFRIFP